MHANGTLVRAFVSVPRWLALAAGVQIKSLVQLHVACIMFTGVVPLWRALCLLCSARVLEPCVLALDTTYKQTDVHAPRAFATS